MGDTNDPDQSAEVFHPPMTQMHLSVDIGKQRTDRATINPGNLGQNIPVDLLQPQTGCKAIQPDRSGKWLRQPHIELPDKRINFHLFEPGQLPYASTYSSNHIIDTPLPCAFSENQKQSVSL
jgi:hypothetical protein